MKSIFLSSGMTLSACRNFYFAIGLALMWGSTMAELNKGRQLFEAGDYKEALAELTAADTVALPEAQNLIGRIYYFGNKDVPINHSHAVAWYRKAAEQGDANAQYNLGFFTKKAWALPKTLPKLWLGTAKPLSKVMP
jgi:TPR repeat protein